MKHTRIGAFLLALCLAMTPAFSLAAETAPLVLGGEATARREDAGKLKRFGNERSWGSLDASDKWLNQVRLDYLMLNLRLYTPEGSGVMMQEKLCRASTGGADVRLCLRQRTNDGGLLLQMDQPALDVLSRVNITEIVLVDYAYYIQAVYRVADLLALREALGLSAGEELSLRGEDEPITVVGEDGVRRSVN